MIFQKMTFRDHQFDLLFPKVQAPEQKSLSEAAELSGCAGVKLQQQMSFSRMRQRSGDEVRFRPNIACNGR